MVYKVWMIILSFEWRGNIEKNENFILYFFSFFWLMIKFRKHDDVPRFQIERMFIKILMFILKKK